MKFLALLLILPALLLAAPFVTVDSEVQSRVSGSDIIADRDGNGIDSFINTAPTISLTGSGTVTYTEGDTYNELGATCTDTQDGSITVPAPSFSPSLNMASPGSYTATYTCTDSGGLTDTATRTVNVNSASSSLSFASVSSSVIDASPAISQVFWAGMPDVNGDGCLDLYIGSHEDAVDSNMLIQDNVGGTCQGTFTHFADADNYSQASPTTPRIASRYMWGNWYGHPSGFWSFYGADVDGSGSARYVLDPTFTTVGGEPSYLTKSTGCYGSRPKCIPLDIDGDGVIEMAYRSYDSPYNAGRIVNKATGATIYDADGAATTSFTESLVVFDADNDGEPEVVSDHYLGYWNFNSGDNSMDWVGSRFPSSFENVTGNHKVPFDYDNDGDLDLFVGHGIYNQTGTFTLRMYQNDGAGNFTDVSNTVFSGISITNTAYNTTYANSFAADLDNDGNIDLVIGGETYGDVVTILQNSGGTFSEFDPGDLTPVNFGADSRRPWVNWGDYDNDGKIDLVHNGDVSGGGAVVVGQLLRNTTNNSNKYLRVRVRGQNENTDGLHSRITFFEAGTSNIITHYEVGAFGLGSQNLITHAGLGSNATVDVRVQYPHGGPTCNFSGVSADQDIVVYRSCDYESYTPGSAIPLTYTPPAAAVNTTITLVADSGITPTATELVTFGVPFAQGDVTSLDEIKVIIGGTEQAVAIEQGLTWWADNSIRSATIQLQNLDMTGGNVTVTVNDTGSSIARLTKQPTLNGWANIIGATKDNHLSPRILPQHDPQYLADSGLIPPYKPDPATPDAYQIYRDDMFDDWGGTPFDYSSSTGAHWLFDRATSHFKGYMASGEAKYLAEAARAKQFYFSHVRNDGTAPAQSGGDGCFTYGGTACADGKYIYPQPAKLALALLGDDSQWDDGLINDMSEQAQLGWNQYWYAFPYDAENDGYTERSHGITMLAIANAYEITGDAGVLADLIQAVDYSRDMQQTTFAWETANGWPDVGCFRHAWSVHEGGPGGYGGDGVADDRRCSPWMSENIADALWQAYWGVDTPSFTNRSDIPEILRQLGEAIESYAYDDSTLAPSGPNVGTLTSCGNACTNMRFCTAGNTPLVFYSMSDIASSAALEATQQSQARPDTHMPEMVLIHAAARYFETSSTINAAHDARIASVNPDYYTQACADWFPSQGVPRVYNWQMRGNAQRTWDWVEEQ